VGVSAGSADSGVFSFAEFWRNRIFTESAFCAQNADSMVGRNKREEIFSCVVGRKNN